MPEMVFRGLPEVVEAEVGSADLEGEGAMLPSSTSGERDTATSSSSFSEPVVAVATGVASTSRRLPSVGVTWRPIFW
jgi:hypothetical protein